jgi:hypothetical protein
LKVYFCFLVLIPSHNHYPKTLLLRFKVDGECAQCKKRIEDAARDKGVSAAKWNVETKLLTLTFDPAKTTAEKVAGKNCGSWS